MRRQLIIALLAAGSLLMLGPLAQAEDIYRWVDENGTVHFGSLPPDGVDATLVSTVPAPAPAPAAEANAAPAPPADPAFAANPEQKTPAQIAREEREQRRAEQREEKALLDSQCAAMRQQVEELEPHTRVIVKDPDGTVRRLDDNERLQAVQDAKDFIAKNCQ